MAVLALTAWRSAPAAAAAPLAGVVALGAIAAWPGLTAPPDPRLLAPAVAEVLRLPDNVSSFLVFAAMLDARPSPRWRPCACGAAARCRMPTAGLYALAAIVPPLLALVLAYLRVTQFDRSISFALFAVRARRPLLSGRRPLSAACREASPRRPPMLATGAFAAGVAAAATLAFVMVLDRGYLTVAFALTALATAYLRRARPFRCCATWWSRSGLIVLGRLAWDPRIMGADVGSIADLQLAAARLRRAGASPSSPPATSCRREREDLAVRLCDALGVLFAALLVFFQIRHALNGGDPLANTSGHVEQGLFALMSLGFAYVLMRLDLGRANPVFRFASLVFGVLSRGLRRVRPRHRREPAAQQRPHPRRPPSSARCCWPTCCRALAAVLLARACARRAAATGT